MTDREFRKHLTEKRLAAILAEVMAEKKKPPATERKPAPLRKRPSRSSRGSGADATSEDLLRAPCAALPIL